MKIHEKKIIGSDRSRLTWIQQPAGGAVAAPGESAAFDARTARILLARSPRRPNSTQLEAAQTDTPICDIFLNIRQDL